ncbi:caspase-3-like [Plakobranchus ocellatus]|uniref:Caspase-3-like n=1 Tax=Plakobranchus ocellatus TaxID=259542 RepID=A0AAV4D2B7_9GAST|nr:caspase-3-like [Plakobranchus ocellatus]
MSDHVDAKGDYDQTDARGETRYDKHRSMPPKVSELDFVSDHYNMKHDERGLALIINNKKFHPRLGLSERTGSDVDAYKMHMLLGTLGFEKIQQHDNVKANDMKDLLYQAAKKDHTDSDCFACVILSHGEEGYVFGTDNKISVDDLVLPFKGDRCTSLAGKPKLFFIQACRGQELDRGTTVADAIGDQEAEEEIVVRSIPTEADFLMAYSVVPGFFSWRNSARGSWFIQAIYDVFTEHWQDLDLLTMMTRVNKKVAYDFESNASEEYMRRKKQIPCITSMLTKDVFFK